MRCDDEEEELKRLKLNPKVKMMGRVVYRWGEENGQ
jgi:hypothetical protein